MRFHPLWLQIAMSSIILLSAPSALARQLNCSPHVRLDCTETGCERTTEHLFAEQFSFNEKTRQLTACLYTDCYEGKANVFYNDNDKTTTAIGELRSSRQGGAAPTFLVSLTYDRSLGFSTIWQYGSRGYTIDMGNCQQAR